MIQDLLNSVSTLLLDLCCHEQERKEKETSMQKSKHEENQMNLTEYGVRISKPQ